METTLTSANKTFESAKSNNYYNKNSPDKHSTNNYVINTTDTAKTVDTVGNHNASGINNVNSLEFFDVIGDASAAITTCNANTTSAADNTNTAIIYKCGKL
jgi:hypothetical protein